MPVDKRAFLYPMTACPASIPKKRLSEMAAAARSPASLYQDPHHQTGTYELSDVTQGTQSGPAWRLRLRWLAGGPPTKGCFARSTSSAAAPEKLTCMQIFRSFT